jgi:hypothetical protein
MGKFNLINKVVMLGLILVSIVLVLWGFLKGYPARPIEDNGTVDPLLYWTYIIFGIAAVSAVLVSIGIMAINDSKSLVKLGIGIVVAGAIVLVAYLLAPGGQPLAYNGEPVTDGTLKLTDTILNLTWFAFAAVIIAIIVGEIASRVRKI